MTEPSACKAMQSDEWALIVDLEVCPHSKTQIQAAKDMELPLKGAILCHLPEHAETEACLQAPAFPMLCNTKTNKCFSGLRDTCDLIQELETLNRAAKAE